MQPEVLGQASFRTFHGSMTRVSRQPETWSAHGKWRSRLVHADSISTTTPISTTCSGGLWKNELARWEFRLRMMKSRSRHSAMPGFGVASEFTRLKKKVAASRSTSSPWERQGVSKRVMSGVSMNPYCTTTRRTPLQEVRCAHDGCQ